MAAHISPVWKRTEEQKLDIADIYYIPGLEPDSFSSLILCVFKSHEIMEFWLIEKIIVQKLLELHFL